MVKTETRDALSGWAGLTVVGRLYSGSGGYDCFSLQDSSQHLFFSSGADGMNALDRMAVVGQSAASAASSLVRVGSPCGGRALILKAPQGRPAVSLIQAHQGGLHLTRALGEQIACYQRQPVRRYGFEPVNLGFSSGSSSWKMAWFREVGRARRHAERRGLSLGALGDRVFESIESRLKVLDTVSDFCLVHGQLSPYFLRFDGVSLVNISGWESAFWGDPLCEWASFTQVDGAVRRSVVKGFSRSTLLEQLDADGSERLALYALGRVFTALNGETVDQHLRSMAASIDRAERLLAMDSISLTCRALLLSGDPPPTVGHRAVQLRCLFEIATLSHTSDVERWCLRALSLIRPGSSPSSVGGASLSMDCEVAEVDFVQPTGGWSLILYALGVALGPTGPLQSLVESRAQLFSGVPVKTPGWQLLVAALSAKSPPLSLKALVPLGDPRERPPALYALHLLEAAGQLPCSPALAKERLGISWAHRW